MLSFEFTNTKARLIEALKNELPGEKAHRPLLPPGRNLYAPADDKSLQSSVLLLLFPIQDQINTCLIRRPFTMRNHGGQIAFPGGRYEPSDEQLVETALRESFEETGTDRNQIEILGALSPLYVQVSNFTINPFVGWSETMPHFAIDSREVDELIITPIERFIHNHPYHFKEVNTVLGKFEVPGFYVDDHFIWGATAMIISELNEIIKRIITG